jgi:hypothetical protein
LIDSTIYKLKFLKWFPWELDLRPPKGGLFFGQKAVGNPEKWPDFFREV